jgi:feruloyl esterase
VSFKPSSGSDIRIEVWLPASGWNGRLQAVGEGGLAGLIPHGFMAPVLSAGYAAAGTDTGHREKRIDFAHRSTHKMAVIAKAAIASCYGKGPSKSYHNGCSGAGRQGLASAQRYPEDFDGIVAGALSWNQAQLDAVRIGINLAVNQSPASRIPASK